MTLTEAMYTLLGIDEPICEGRYSSGSEAMKRNNKGKKFNLSIVKIGSKKLLTKELERNHKFGIDMSTKKIYDIYIKGEEYLESPKDIITASVRIIKNPSEEQKEEAKKMISDYNKIINLSPEEARFIERNIQEIKDAETGREYFGYNEPYARDYRKNNNNNPYFGNPLQLLDSKKPSEYRNRKISK